MTDYELYMQYDKVATMFMEQIVRQHERYNVHQIELHYNFYWDNKYIEFIYDKGELVVRYDIKEEGYTYYRKLFSPTHDICKRAVGARRYSILSDIFSKRHLLHEDLYQTLQRINEEHEPHVFHDKWLDFFIEQCQRSLRKEPLLRQKITVSAFALQIS